MRESVIINEVGLRDGLQNQQKLVPTDQKLDLLVALLRAGVRNVEVTSFVSPKAVPQMADAAEIYSQLPAKDSIDYSVLVPNMRGYERARESGAASVAVVTACTKTMNQRNINMSLDQAIATAKAIVRRAAVDKVVARIYLATAFVCPFEGAVDPARVHQLAGRMLDLGAAEVIVADTIGAANPVEVARMFEVLVPRHGAQRLSGHFHDTKGLALANTFAALERGIRKFDASIGGMGGCPFAPGAAGNAATEDVVNMLESAGYATGIDLDALAAAVIVAERCVERSLGGRWMSWRRSKGSVQTKIQDE